MPLFLVLISGKIILNSVMNDKVTYEASSFMAKFDPKKTHKCIALKNLRFYSNTLVQILGKISLDALGKIMRNGDLRFIDW